jgi:hypothetical protein
VKGKLATAYVLGLASICVQGAPGRTGELTNHELASDIRREGGAVKGALQEVKDNVARWQEVLPDLNEAVVSRVDTFLNSLAESYDAHEQRTIAAGTISDAKVASFLENVVERRNKAGVARNLFKRHGLVTAPVEEFGAGTVALGISQIFPKEAFFDDWYAHWVDLGGTFGEGLAHAEDSQVFEQLANNCAPRGALHSLDQLVEHVEALSREQGRQPRGLIVLASSGLTADLRVWDNDAFIPAWKLGGRKDAPGFVGALKVGSDEVHMYELAYQKGKFVLAGAPREMGTLVLTDLHPGQAFEGASARDGLLCRVVDLNANDARRAAIMGADPDWLQVEPNKEAYLRKTVVIDVRERVALVPQNATWGNKWDVVGAAADA